MQLMYFFFFENTSRYMHFILRVQKRRLLAQHRFGDGNPGVLSDFWDFFPPHDNTAGEIINKGVSVGICQQGSLNVAHRPFNVRNTRKAVLACSRVRYNVFFTRVKKAFRKRRLYQCPT